MYMHKQTHGVGSEDVRFVVFFVLGWDGDGAGRGCEFHDVNLHRYGPYGVDMAKIPSRVLRSDLSMI